MYRAITAEQAKAIEARAVSETGAILGDLMHRAGSVVAEQVAQVSAEGRVVLLTGPGNNGGDGWVAARELAATGRDVLVVAVKAPDALAGEAADAAKGAAGAGVAWVPAEKRDAADIAGAAVIVDALLGTGSELPLRDSVATLCAEANASPATRVAVDLPTGIDADSGAAVEGAFRADLTVTFTTPKLGCVTYPAASYCGEVVVADIGVPETFVSELRAPELWLDEDYAAQLPLPEPDAHKNSRGRVLVIAGSGSFTGAAVLAARGAMRAGAGYVTLAVPRSIVHIVQAHLLAAPVVGLPAARGHAFSAHAGDVALELANDYDAVVLGPGMTLADGAVVTARRVFAHLRKPLVVDADALNSLMDAEELLDTRDAPTVLTPHPGELSRLLGQPISDIQRDRLTASSWLAKGKRAVVLKGAGTVVSGADRQAIITAGSPALATAGTGDVLAGVIGTLLAQGLEPYIAGVLGAYLHARAGEEAAAERTPLGVIADDIPEHLPDVFADLLGIW